MKKGHALYAALLALLLLVATTAFARSASSKSSTRKSSGANVSESASTKKKLSAKRHSRRTRRSAKGRRHRRYYERFYTSSYAEDVTAGDVAAGEDPIVRAAAVEALGNMNGTVVAVDPTSGRILTMVNQKLALAEGATPCSTIKLVTAPHVPVPFSPALEDLYIPSVAKIEAAVTETMDYGAKQAAE